MSYQYKVQQEITPGMWQDIYATYDMTSDAFLRAMVPVGGTAVLYESKSRAIRSAQLLRDAHVSTGAIRVVRVYILPEQVVTEQP